MLRGNLSTRPFYNERAVHVLLAVAGLVLVLLSIVSVSQFLALSRQQGELSARIARDEQRAQALRRDAADIRRGIDEAELQTTVAATQEVNRAIDARVFSWTALFNTVERTIPPAVMLLGVYPSVEDDGRVDVRMVVNARRIDDVNAFMEALERAQSFEALQSSEEQRIDDGSFIVTFDGRYVGHLVPETDAPTPASAAGGLAQVTATGDGR